MNGLFSLRPVFINMKDSTKLFNKYHSWVNPEYMLARCYLGDLEATGDADDDIDGQSDETEEERADPVV